VRRRERRRKEKRKRNNSEIKTMLLNLPRSVRRKRRKRTVLRAAC
jgi:hypothetical protein